MEVAAVPAASPVACTPRRELRLPDLTRHLPGLAADAVARILNLAPSKPSAVTFHGQRMATVTVTSAFLVSRGDDAVAFPPCSSVSAAACKMSTARRESS
jgi:hypothetical protein